MRIVCIYRQTVKFQLAPLVLWVVWAKEREISIRCWVHKTYICGCATLARASLGAISSIFTALPGGSQSFRSDLEKKRGKKERKRGGSNCEWRICWQRMEIRALWAGAKSYRERGGEHATWQSLHYYLSILFWRRLCATTTKPGKPGSPPILCGFQFLSETMGSPWPYFSTIYGKKLNRGTYICVYN